MDEAVRAEVIARWTARRQGELGSAQAMTTMAAGLDALFGPTAEAAALREVAADEVRHAATCEAVLNRLGAPPTAPTDLPGVPPSAATTPAGALAQDVVFLLCAGETIATQVLLDTAKTATDPAIRQALTDIARDEARHAALGWRVLDLLIDGLDAPTTAALAQATRRQVARAYVAYEQGSPPHPSPEALRHGVRGRDDVAATAKAVIGAQVVPKLHARGLWSSRHT